MKPIRNSAKAVIIQEGKLLLTKNQDEQGFFYLFPGGGQEFGEELIHAVIRECMEEIGSEVIVNDLIHVREYIGKNHQFADWDSNVHQVEFYFICQLKDAHANISNGVNPDSYQVGVEWVDLGTLEEIRLYPKTLGTILKNKMESRIYIGDVN